MFFILLCFSNERLKELRELLRERNIGIKAHKTIKAQSCIKNVDLKLMSKSHSVSDYDQGYKRK